MAKVSVKAVEGRVVYDMPRGGKIIPSDRFVSVSDSNYIRRLVEVHKDLILEKPAAKAQPKPAAATTAPTKPTEAPKT